MEITKAQIALFLILMILSFSIFAIITINSIKNSCDLYDTLIRLEKRDKPPTKTALWGYLLISLISILAIIWIIDTIISMLINVLKI